MGKCQTHTQLIYPGECNCVMCVCFDIRARLKCCPLFSHAEPLWLSPFHLHLSLSPSFFLSVPDIDECLAAAAQPCSAGFNCVNTVGSYMCHRKITCSRGYHASPDGARCVGKIFAHVTHEECELRFHTQTVIMHEREVA